MKAIKIFASIMVVGIVLMLLGILPTPFSYKSTEKIADNSGAKRVEIDTEDEGWYVLRYSARVDNDGRPTNECAKSDLSPAEVMEGARKNGMQYKVVDDIQQSKDGRASAVSITMTVDGVERDYFFFRGKQFCLFASEKLMGNRAHDSSAYR